MTSATVNTYASRVPKVRTISSAIILILLMSWYRWLIANHRRAEAIEILTKLRGDLSETDPNLIAEIEQLDAIVQDSRHKRNSYINIFLGGRYSGALHLGRRAVFGAALQTVSSANHHPSLRRLNDRQSHRKTFSDVYPVLGQIQQWTGILAIVSRSLYPYIIQAWPRALL